MRAVVITKHGDPSVLQVQQRPDPPPPGAGQLRIAVRAAGVNFADHPARVGLYPDAPKLPAVVGYEVAGTVEAVGEGVDADRVGQRVLAGTRFGGYSEIVNVAANDSVPLPDAMSFEQGAAVPVNYATAWAALHGYGSLRAGERVLVHAAAGGVGIAAVQFAKAAGAEVHGTASPGKHQKLTELGVDRAIDYRRDGWWRGLGPYDLVLDALGGTSLRRAYALLAPGGVETRDRPEHVAAVGRPRDARALDHPPGRGVAGRHGLPDRSRGRPVRRSTQGPPDAGGAAEHRQGRAGDLNDCRPRKRWFPPLPQRLCLSGGHHRNSRGRHRRDTRRNPGRAVRPRV